MIKQVDAKGLICPLPVLKARKALIHLVPGERLSILATDEAAPQDFALFCAEAGHKLVSVAQQDNVFILIVERGA